MRPSISVSFRLQMCAPKSANFCEHAIVDFIVDDDGLFGGADGAVVEGLRGDDVHHGHVQVGGFFQIDRRVARTHAQRRLAGAVGGFDRARSAGGVDQADVFVMHQVDVVLRVWDSDAGEDAFGRAMLHRRLRT